jgi:urea transporter
MDGDGMKIRDFFSTIAHSFFNDRAWLGMTLLVAIAVFDPLAAAMGLAGAGLSLLSSWGTLQPWALRNFGLIPLNGLFLGLGLHAHFAQVPQTLLYLVLGASLLPTLAKALHGVFAGLRLGVLILPALILLWTFALISNSHLRLALHPRNGSSGRGWFLSRWDDGSFCRTRGSDWRLRLLFFSRAHEVRWPGFLV